MSVTDPFVDITSPLNPTNGNNSQITFISIVVAVTISFILIAFWTRVFENFAFGTLGLNGDLFWHALIVSIALTVIFFAAVWVIDQYQLISGSLEADVEAVN